MAAVGSLRSEAFLVSGNPQKLITEQSVRPIIYDLIAIRDALNTSDNDVIAKAASVANVNVASGPATIDGVAMVAGDIVLLKDQAAGAENDVWVWNGLAVAMTRYTTATMEAGLSVRVVEGTLPNADTTWVVATNNPITRGVTAVAFIKVSANVFGAGTAGKSTRWSAADTLANGAWNDDGTSLGYGEAISASFNITHQSSAAKGFRWHTGVENLLTLDHDTQAATFKNLSILPNGTGNDIRQLGAGTLRVRNNADTLTLLALTDAGVLDTLNVKITPVGAGTDIRHTTGAGTYRIRDNADALNLVAITDAGVIDLFKLNLTNSGNDIQYRSTTAVAGNHVWRNNANSLSLVTITDAGEVGVNVAPTATLSVKTKAAGVYVQDWFDAAGLAYGYLRNDGQIVLGKGSFGATSIDLILGQDNEGNNTAINVLIGYNNTTTVTDGGVFLFGFNNSGQKADVLLGDNNLNSTVGGENHVAVGRVNTFSGGNDGIMIGSSNTMAQSGAAIIGRSITSDETGGFFFGWQQLTFKASPTELIGEVDNVTLDGGLNNSPNFILRAKYDSDPGAGVTSTDYDATIRHMMLTGGAGPTSRIDFGIAGSPYASLTSVGRFGIGVTGPTSLLDVAGDVEVGAADAHYFGDPTTDGTWKFVRSGTSFIFQRREAGVYVTKDTILA